MAAETLTFSDDKRSPGWPSFYTYYPEYIQGMNGYLYTFSEGNLYRHNTNSLRNNYYGNQGISTITSVFNPEPTLSIKLFKTMSYESSHSWAVTDLNTDLSSGSMLETYFEQKEGEWYSYIRSKSGTVDWKLRSGNGIATCTGVTGPATATAAAAGSIPYSSFKISANSLTSFTVKLTNCSAKSFKSAILIVFENFIISF